MSKYVVNVFKNPEEPIEVFCPQKYKGYYIRGKVEELSDNIYDETLDESYGYAYYHLRVFVLIRNNYFKQCDKNDYYSYLGLFFGKDKDDFLKRQRNYDLSLAEDISQNSDKSSEQIINSEIHNPPITVNISEIDFEENEYLTNCIKSKKDIILLSMEINLDRVESSKDKHTINGYPKRIHQLLGYHLSGSSQYEERETAEWFWDLYDMAYFNLDYDFMSRREYRNILSKIGDLSNLWLRKRTITEKYLTLLNKFISTIGYGYYPFHDFCYQFFGNLLKELIENKKICQCDFCGDVFKFKVGKKYCTLVSEGKDCGKKARNRRFYLKHKDTILPKARKLTKELRAFYKEKGIKK